MKLGLFDFSKLPKTEYVKIKKAINQNEWRPLALANNKYQLSKFTYCCRHEADGMVAAFEIANNNKWFDE